MMDEKALYERDAARDIGAELLQAVRDVKNGEGKVYPGMVEFKTQYGMREFEPLLVTKVEMEGNLTVLTVHDYAFDPIRYIVSDSYSEAMRKLGRNV